MPTLPIPRTPALTLLLTLFLTTACTSPHRFTLTNAAETPAQVIIKLPRRAGAPFGLSTSPGAIGHFLWPTETLHVGPGTPITYPNQGSWGYDLVLLLRPGLPDAQSSPFAFHIDSNPSMKGVGLSITIEDHATTPPTVTAKNERGGSVPISSIDLTAHDTLSDQLRTWLQTLGWLDPPADNPP